MFMNNIVMLVANSIFYAFAAITAEDDSLTRLMSDSTLVRDALMMSICGATGQIFIFLTISIFDGYKVSIITTTRKCFSVVASNFMFNHKFTQT